VVAFAFDDSVLIQMDNPLQNRRLMLDAARRFLLEPTAPGQPKGTLRPDADPPRLTLNAIEKIRMSRSRERILTNLDEMYQEAFARVKETGDQQQMATLDFAYRREQLYFEILLDVRDAVERDKV
jgi:hypothetical protein